MASRSPAIPFRAQLGVAAAVAVASASCAPPAQSVTQRTQGTTTADTLQCSTDTITTATTSPLIGSPMLSGQWDSASVGQGFNYLSGQLAGDCTDTAPPTRGGATNASPAPAPAPTPTAPGTPAACTNPLMGTQKYRVIQEDSMESLAKQLQLGASMSGGGLAWSAAASANFAESAATTSYSRFLMIDATVEFQEPTTAASFALSREHLKLLGSKGPTRFLKTCGDHYIRSIWRGGTFHAVFHFKARSDAEARSVASAITASVGTFNSSAALAASFSKISTTTQLDVYVLKSGGGFTVAGKSPDQLLSQLDDFFCHIDSSTAPPVRIELAPYDTIYTGGKTLAYTGNHAQTVHDLALERLHLATDAATLDLFAKQSADECPDASTEARAIVDAKRSAIRGLDQVSAQCAALDKSCHMCSPTGEAAKTAVTTQCVQCASDSGRGAVVGGVCRRCTWDFGARTYPDAAIGEKVSDNDIVSGTCMHMTPGASVEVRIKGTFSMTLTNTQGCDQTTLDSNTSYVGFGNGTVAKSFPYNFKQSRTTTWPDISLNGAAGGWSSTPATVAADGTVNPLVRVRSYAYNCDNFQGFGRRFSTTGFQVQVCEQGYCQ